MLRQLGVGYKARATRHAVFIPARMRVGPSWIAVVIHNLSSGGALLASDEAPGRGTYVEVRRGQQTIIGRVIWRKDRYFGIQSRGTIDITAIVNEPRLAHRPKSTKEGEVLHDRRARSRMDDDANIAQSIENSRRWSSLFQYGIFVILAIAIAGFVALEVYDFISKTMTQVKGVL